MLIGLGKRRESWHTAPYPRSCNADPRSKTALSVASPPSGVRRDHCDEVSTTLPTACLCVLMTGYLLVKRKGKREETPTL